MGMDGSLGSRSRAPDYLRGFSDEEADSFLEILAQTDLSYFRSFLNSELWSSIEYVSIDSWEYRERVDAERIADALEARGFHWGWSIADIPSDRSMDDRLKDFRAAIEAARVPFSPWTAIVSRDTDPVFYFTNPENAAMTKFIWWSGT